MLLVVFAAPYIGRSSSKIQHVLLTAVTTLKTHSVILVLLTINTLPGIWKSTTKAIF
jgi:glutamate racemase